MARGAVVRPASLRQALPLEARPCRTSALRCAQLLLIRRPGAMQAGGPVRWERGEGSQQQSFPKLGRFVPQKAFDCNIRPRLSAITPRGVDLIDLLPIRSAQACPAAVKAILALLSEYQFDKTVWDTLCRFIFLLLSVIYSKIAANWGLTKIFHSQSPSSM